VQYCSNTQQCIALTIVTNTSNPDLLITLQAPSSHKWFAFGFGSQMAGSLIFAAWPNGDKVTVGTRLATFPPHKHNANLCRGHTLPQPYSSSTIEVLGMNVTRTTTNVNFRCANCVTWTSGNVDIQSTANMIWAYGLTAPNGFLKNSNAAFTQHDAHGNFQMNLAQAQDPSATSAPPVISKGSQDANSEPSSNRQRATPPPRKPFRADLCR
jgi:Cytochrome domain of cellobiose dehydrogenase